MSGVALVPGKSQVSDANGNPLAGGTVDVYLAGTTTRTNSWQDQALTTLNTNPIVLDASGSCSMWLDGSTLYKIVVKNATGAVQSHLGGDNISGASGSSSLTTFLQAGTGAVSRSAQNKMRDVVSVKDFGAVGDGVTDDTAAFALARDCPANTVYIPDGTYVCSEFRLTAYKNWIGQSEKGVKIIPKTGVSTPVVTMDVGPVPQFRMENIWFDGSTAAAGQHCMYLYAQAQAGSPFDGGLWYSTFKKVAISGFTGHSIWMRGGATGFLLPMQFNTFEQVNVDRGSTTTGRCLLMTGQNGQNLFLNCRFDGVAVGSGSNIELSREFTNVGTTGGSTVGGSANGDNAPGTNRFVLTTTQNAQYGYRIDRCTNTYIDGCWFENLHYGVDIQTASIANRINACHFANAASDGSGNGYAVRVGSTCRADGSGNYILGSYDRTFVGSSHIGMSFANTILEAAADSKTSGIVRQLGDSAGTLSTFGLNDIVVNNTTNTITTITSYLGAGDTITIRALSSYVKFAEGGNLRLPGGKSVVLRGSDYIVFKREDLISAWFAVLINRARLDASAMPSTGYYEAGEFVWNTAPSIAAGKVLLGWSRLTTGTAHVLNTDWSNCYVTNT